VNNRIIAPSEINRQKGNQKHVDVVGTLIEKSFRELGIGTAMMRILIERTKKMGLKVFTLTANAGNRRARATHVYEKVEFVLTGLIPKKHLKQGKFIDEVIMTKLLE